MKNMEKRIKDFLKENNVNIDNTVIVAVSGGADSVCLLSVLYNLGHKVVLAHVNHHKRLQSETEEKAMKALAERLNIPFELLSYHYDGADNFHNDSHNARYDFFRSLCKKYDTNIIATAHHRDDQIETVLMKLMEGSNLYGYGGIALCNDDGEYRIIRPLLCVSKDEIYEYAKSHGLETFEDSSNHEDGFLRNRLRHHVVPLLKEECPALGEKVMEYSIQAHEAFEFIRKQSRAFLDKNNDVIDVVAFGSFDIALKKDILSLLLERKEIRKNKDILYSMLNILSVTDGSQSITLMKGYRFLRSYDKAYVCKEKETDFKEVLLYENGEAITGNYRFYFTNSHNNILSKYIQLCYNDLVFPMTIRFRKAGDEMKLGIGTKKVSRILIDAKVPEAERDSVPLVVNGNGEILWAYNHAKSDTVVKAKGAGDIYLVCEVMDHDER